MQDSNGQTFTHGSLFPPWDKKKLFLTIFFALAIWIYFTLLSVKKNSEGGKVRIVRYKLRITRYKLAI